jgi:hypothetical protein
MIVTSRDEHKWTVHVLKALPPPRRAASSIAGHCAGARRTVQSPLLLLL